MYRSEEFDAIPITSFLYLDVVASSFFDVVAFRVHRGSKQPHRASVYAHSMLSLAVSALAGTCNVLQASTAISICLVLLQLSWRELNEDIT
jgi:hypothetical protein